MNESTLNIDESKKLDDKLKCEGNRSLKNKLKCLDNYVNELIKIFNFYNNHHKSSDTLPLLLLHGPSGCGKTRIVEAACSKLNLDISKINAVTLAGESASAIEKRVEIFLDQSLRSGPCLILLKSFHFLFKLKDINEYNKRVINTFFNLISNLKIKQNELTPNSFFIICTTNIKQILDPSITSHFYYEIEVKNLNDQQRIDFFIEELNISSSNQDCMQIALPKNDKKLTKSELEQLMKKTSGLYYGEMRTLLDFIKKDLYSTNEELSFSDLIQSSLNKFALNRKFYQENKLNIENINWNDVGGLSEIKQIIIDTILLPLQYPLLFSSNDKQLGITRSGILMYGPPGTGKTLLAKAISNECGLNFLSVKGPELLDMYVGQTELNVRNLFEKARLNSPCILFFDELDSLAPVRGRAGDSGGVMDRVVSQLLTEIDGLDKYNSLQADEKPTQIFLIGATNRPDLIDPSLLRPGRFDKLVYVPISKSFNERLNIFKALIRKLPIDKNFQVEDFIKKCPLNLSGADFYSITNKARQHALKRLIISIEESENKEPDDALIIVNGDDFNQALVEFQPTLTESALLEYEKYFLSFSNK